MKITRISTLTASAGLLVLTACTSIEAPTTDPNLRKNEGIGLGAATGALFGLLAGKTEKEKRNSAIAGAIIGGAVGAAIGADLDRQAAELRASMGDGRIRIINNGDHLVVRMPQDILFDFDSTRVKPALHGDLRAVAQNLQRYPDSTVVVVGHTDSVGGAAYNLDLSSRRASAVAAILVGNGVSPGRIRTVGRGENEPIATNLTPEGRARNRRVEIIIRPTG